MIVDAYSLQAQRQAVACLVAGELVAIPTETVYGLAADASQPAAVAKIFQLKQRPMTNPLIVHISSISQMTDWAINIPDCAYHLAAAFWPGPMTLILTKAPWVPSCVTAGQETIALRIPAHLATLALLKLFKGGLAAPSANLFTQLSPTTAKHVEYALGLDLLILDGGPAQVGIESTIIDCSSPKIAILRPGAVSADSVSTVLNQTVNYHENSELKRAGSHWLHYAPQAALHLVSREQLVALWVEVDVTTSGFIIYSKEQMLPSSAQVLELSAEPSAYARELYSALHALDQRKCQHIFVELPPVTASWYAIHERLRKASAKVSS